MTHDINDPLFELTTDDVGRMAWEVTAPSAVSADTDAFMASLRERIAAESSSTHAVPRRPSLARLSALRSSHAIWSRWRAGAVIGAFVLVIAGVLTQRASRVTQPETQIYATAASEQKTITLTGGSSIVLGPSTTLTIRSSNAHGAGTTATVQGIAQFTVQHADRTPLSVVTRAAVTRVLGTTFLVRQYATDSVAHVLVTDGRVSVRGTRDGEGATKILGAGMLAVLTDSAQARVTSNVSLDDYRPWMTGQLIFRQTPARVVLADLARAFDLDITLEDSALASHRLTLTVPIANRSADDVLTAVVLALDAHYTKTGRTITIAPGRRSSARPTSPLSSESRYGR